MLLHKYFRLKGIEPGRVITQQFGEIDFQTKIPLDVLKQLHASGFPYLELTKEGEKRLSPKPKPQAR